MGSDGFDPFKVAKELTIESVDTMLTGGQYGKYKKKKEEKEQKRRTAYQTKAGLLKAIRDDKTISDITKDELLLGVSKIKSGTGEKALSGFTNTFLDAQAGISPKFRSRQGTQAMFETLFEQPGRVQTIAGKANRNNSFTG